MLRIDANEGRCILSDKDLREILSPEIARRYPARELLEKPLAERLGLPQSCVLATAGADDAIDRAVRTLAGPGGLVLGTHPGFVEFLAAAQRSSARFEPIPKDPFGPFPVSEICDILIQRRPNLLILSSPDNPSGRVLLPADVAQISAACRESGTIFIFDATYGDFSPNTARPTDALAFSNVLVSGSFSKSSGLAGFRIGYMAGNPQMQSVIDRLVEAGPPYSLSSSAIEAGRRALAIDPRIRQAFVEEIRREVRELGALMKKMGFTVSEGESNFVLIKSDDAPLLADALREKEIFVRTWPGKADYKNLVRITAPGEAHEFDELTDAIISIGKAMNIYKEARA